VRWIEAAGFAGGLSGGGQRAGLHSVWRGGNAPGQRAGLLSGAANAAG